MLPIRTIVATMFIVFVSLSLLTFGSIYGWVQSADRDSSLINIAGRQRMLVQNAMKLSFMVHSGGQLNGPLQDVIQLFESSQDLLLNGDKVEGQPPLSDPMAKNLLNEVNASWQDYKTQLEAIASGSELTSDIIAKSAASSANLLKLTNQVTIHFEELAKAKVENLVIRALITTAITLLASALGYFIIQRLVLSRTKTLGETLAQLESSLDLTQQIKVGRMDEIGVSAFALNNLIIRFKDLCTEFKQGAENIETTAQSLSKLSAVTSNDMESQQQATLMVATAIEEMSATVQEVSANTSKAADAANSCNESAQQGDQVVSMNLSSITELAAAIEETAVKVTDLGKNSLSIGSILDTIRNIAEQTNLLALNAAIEAARAGEQGRGFAVVADEVRSLAQRTQQATQEINGLIEGLQAGVKDTEQAMQAGSQKAETAVESATMVRQSLAEIINKVGEIVDMNVQNASATEQQNSTIGEINTGVGQVRDMANRATEAMREVNELNHSLLQLSEEFTQKVNCFKLG